VGSAVIQVNSLEICARYCLELHKQVLSSAANTFERPEDLAKTNGCADGLVELSR
jgi:hypothetical protein